ncbi:MAG: ferritin [Planctomycetota bacterium]
MLSDRMEEALNEQLNAELYSAYLYLSMAAYFEQRNLQGFAHWLELQAQEETAHAMKFYRFVLDRGGRATMGAIDAPPAEWDSPLAAFQAVYDHECKVTALIDELVDLAEEEGDRPAQSFLQWFVDEQVEEEASADDIVQKLKMTGGGTGALFMLDNTLGQRQPAAEEEEGEE